MSQGWFNLFSIFGFIGSIATILGYFQLFRKDKAKQSQLDALIKIANASTSIKESTESHATISRLALQAEHSPKLKFSFSKTYEQAELHLENLNTDLNITAISQTSTDIDFNDTLFPLTLYGNRQVAIPFNLVNSNSLRDCDCSCNITVINIIGCHFSIEVLKPVGQNEPKTTLVPLKQF